MIGRITKIRKRDGRIVDFDESKIADAIHKAGCAVGRENRFLAEELAGVVTLFLEKSYAGTVPGIEEIQDMVEKVLIETGHASLAKAYILYRERRARAREQVRVHGESRAGPLVGNPAKALVGPWSKARIAAALVREADLDEKVAAEVATRVEEKVFERGVTRITTSVIRSLVEAELFARGFGDRVGRQALVGLPRYDLDRLLRGGKGPGWRPAGPADLRRSVSDAVLAQYALSEIYSEEVVEAHLDARLHILDAGSPFDWLAAVAQAPIARDADGWVESIAALAGRLGGLVTRELTLRGLVPDPCVWCESGGGPGPALAAARRLLAHSAFQILEPCGGRRGVALAFPALPAGADAARLAEGLVREHWARFREGRLEGLPRLVLELPAERLDTEEARRALLPALAAAAETGRLLFRFDRDEAPIVTTPWFRVPAAEPGVAGALPVGGAVAVNVAALAARLPEAREPALLEALDGALTLALKALGNKRSFLAALQADPAGPLYRVAAGAHPLVAGERTVDFVQLVGLAGAARRLEREPSSAARLAGRLRSYASVRIAEEGRASRLRAYPAPDRDREAARRFREADQQRFGEDLPEQDYADGETYALPAEIAFPGVAARLEPITGTLELRFARDEAPGPEALYDGLCLLARDPRVGAVSLAPWPDRSLRPGAADL